MEISQILALINKHVPKILHFLMDNRAYHVKLQNSLILEIYNVNFALLKQALIQVFTYVHIRNTIQISTHILQIIVVG